MTTHLPVEIEDLFGDLDSAKKDETWYVIHVKPNREKKLAEYSRRNEINYYLPLVESVRKYKYRKITFTKPLFPSYIFMKCTQEQKRILIISGHCVNFLKVPAEKILLDQLRSIKFGTERGVEFKSTSFLKEGFKVEIISGPFTGLTGVVTDGNDVNEVILQVNMLRQAVAVSATTDQIRVISKILSEEQ